MRDNTSPSSRAFENLVLAASAPLLFCSQLHAEPLSTELIYTGELWSNQRGGISQDEVYLDNLDLTLTLDAERAWGWDGVTVFAYGLYNNNDTLSDRLVSSVY